MRLVLYFRVLNYVKGVNPQKFYMKFILLKSYYPIKKSSTRNIDKRT